MRHASPARSHMACLQCVFRRKLAEFGRNYTIILAVLCPLCGQRKARRSCPAIGQQICAICCGTKRLVEIACPGTCVYLASAREHPAAAVLRRQQHDVASLLHYMRDLSERQGRLFLVVSTFLARYAPEGLQTPIDDDAIEACGSVAATLETASRGVIYEHRPSTLAAERLAAALKPLLNEAAQGRGGSAYERDAAVVLRRVEQAARDVHAQSPSAPRAFFDLVARVARKPDDDERGAREPAPEPSRLILP